MKKPGSNPVSYRFRLIVAAGILSAVSLFSYPAVAARLPSSIQGLPPTIRILDTSGRSYASIESMFRCVGLSVSSCVWPEFVSGATARNVLLIVPGSEALLLSREQSNEITKIVRSGARLITDGKSILSRALGIEFLDRTAKIYYYFWKNHREARIYFPKGIDIDCFRPGAKMEIWGGNPALREPICVSGELGKGSFIYSAIALAPPEKAGYEHFPFIFEAVRERFGLRPVLARRDMAVYMDLGLHFGQDPLDVAKKVKSWGIDQVHLSAWYPTKEGQKFTKDFIEAAHGLGITVYAWLEYPMVSKPFWEAHPECREKTATGREALIDWRYHIALEDSGCMKLVKQDLTRSIMSQDWDGIDIAELYFESPHGYDAPQNFTPMHPSFCTAFEKRFGVDPRQIFMPDSKNFWKKNEKISRALLDCRIELIGELNESLLKLCRKLRSSKPYLRTIMTVIDTIFDSSMKDRIGVDTDRFIELQKSYPFALEIEDPYTLWNLGPGRYKLIGEKYRFLSSSKHPLYIDINIVEREGEVYPTAKQRGLELYQLLNSAGLYTDKVILYGSATLEPSDMALARYAQAQGIEIEECGKNRLRFSSERPFIWETEARNKQWYIDGKKWPCFSQSGVILPAGKHTVRFSKEPEKNLNSSLRIEDISGRIIAAGFDRKGLRAKYESYERCFITLSRDIKKLKVDGEDFRARRIKNGKNTVLILPEGRHEISVD